MKERGWRGKNNGVLIPQEGKSCQMPPLSDKRAACQEYVPTSNSTEQRQERLTCQHTGLDMKTGGGEKRRDGQGVSGRTSNSVYKQPVRVYYQNVCEKQCHYTLFFTAQPKMCRCAEACMCGCAQV